MLGSHVLRLILVISLFCSAAASREYFRGAKRQRFGRTRKLTTQEHVHGGASNIDLVEGSGEYEYSNEEQVEIEGSGEGDGEEHPTNVESSDSGNGVQWHPKTLPSVPVVKIVTAKLNKPDVPMLEEVERRYIDENDDVHFPNSAGAGSCKLDINDLPADAFMAPYNRPLATYPDEALLVVRMNRCTPLSVYYRQHNNDKVLCSQLSFHGDYPFKCIDGAFRHGIQTSSRVHKVACGTCRIAPDN